MLTMLFPCSYPLPLFSRIHFYRGKSLSWDRGPPRSGSPLLLQFHDPPLTNSNFISQQPWRVYSSLEHTMSWFTFIPLLIIFSAKNAPSPIIVFSYLFFGSCFRHHLWKIYLIPLSLDSPSLTFFYSIFYFYNALNTLCISRSVVSQFFATPWTVAHQAPLSMGFPRQEYWSGLPFPSAVDLSNPRIELGSPTLQVDSLLCEPPGRPNTLYYGLFIWLYLPTPIPMRVWALECRGCISFIAVSTIPGLNEFISLIRWTGFLFPYLLTFHCNDVGHFAQNLRFLRIATTHPETEDEVLGTEGI